MTQQHLTYPLNFRALLRVSAVLAITSLLTACITSPSYKALDIGDTLTWSQYLHDNGLLDNNTLDGDIDPQWWKSYNTPVLNNLIEQALRDNLSIKMVESKIREARAAQLVDLAALRPTLGFEGSAVDQQVSENGVLPIANIPGFEVEQTVYQANFDASWEIDLFGRNPKRRRIAQAKFDTTIDQQRDLQLSIVAEIARAYFSLIEVTQQQQLLSQKQTLQTQVVRAMRAKQLAGDISISELDAERMNLVSLKAQYPSLTLQGRQLETQLAVLVGKPTFHLESSTVDVAPDSDLVKLVAQQLTQPTSDLLRRRFDIRNAERAYMIAQQRTDLAKLAVYPTFRLFGAIGPETTDVDSLFDSESLAINLGGLIKWPLYLGGQLSAQSTIAKEQLLQAELSYREQVLRALQEVETQATQVIELARILRLGQTMLGLQEQSAQREQTRYDAGTISLVSLLKSKHRLVSQEQQHLSQKNALQQASIAFNKSLGGGWQLFSDE